MRIKFRSSLSLLLLAFVMLLSLPAMALAQAADGSDGGASPAPTIQSDKEDYAPAETVTLTGSGWQPGESVHIYVNDDEGKTWSRDVDVTADDSGRVQDQFQLPDWFVAVYNVTATGESGSVAKTTFTDGNLRATGGGLTGGEKWKLTWSNYKDTVTCNTPDDPGTVIEGPKDETLGAGNNSNNIAANNGQSAKLQASATLVDNTGTKVFEKWTDHNGAVVSHNQNREICVVGFGTGTRAYTAHYVANRAPVANNDSYSVNEDGTLTVDAPGVLGNDTDADNNTLTASTVAGSGPSNGTLSFNANGSFTYTPNANFNGTNSFKYKASDGTAASNEATVNLTVTAVDDNPVAVNDTKTVAEDANATTIDVRANDTDIDGGPKTIASVTQPTNGTVAITNSGSDLTYKPNANYCNGGSPTDNFTYTLNGGSTATVAVTVTCVNDAPDASNDTATTDEDTSALVDVKANDTDVDGDALNITNVTNPAHGTAVVDNGKVNYTPNADYHGPDSFEYTVSDGKGGTDTATVNLTVNAVNDAPTCENVAIETAEDTQGSVAADCSDVDGDTLTYEIVDQAADGTASVDGGDLKYAPNANFNGSDSFTYRASDGTASSAAATVDVTVNAVNDAPVAVDDSLATDEDIAGNGNVLTNDTDVDSDNLTAVLVSGPSHGELTLNSDGSFTYTPDANYNGPDSFTYEANDGTADSNTATVSLTVNAVNDAPIAHDDTKTTDEDTQLTFPSSDLVSNDDEGAANESGQTLTVTAVFDGTHGTVSLGNDGNITFTPEADFNGDATFDYRVCDNGSPSKCSVETATVKVLVNAVNDAPSFQKGADETVNEDAAAQSVSGWATAISAGPSNESDQAVDFVVTNNNDSLFSARPEVSANGTLSYTPAANANGTATVSVKIHDDGGTANGGDDTSDEQTFTITINAVNDAPVADNDSYDVDEDNTLNVAAPGVLGNDNDIDSNDITAILVDDAAHGQLTLNNNGSFSYTPANNYNGSDSFTYKANDGDLDSNTVTVSITVNAVNDAPVAKDDSATTDEDTATNINVITNDTDVDNTNAELSVSSFTQPANGTVTKNADGTLKYNPAANYNGPDSFTYKAKDASADSNSATVSLTVNAVNDAPTVTLSGAVIANEGDSPTYNFTVNDPDSGDTFTVKSGFPDCGTGSMQVGQTSTTSSGGTFKCSFPDGPANPTVGIQVTDGAHADSNVATQSVRVDNVNPTIGPLTVTGNSGIACNGSTNVVKVSFSITDPGADTHSGTINWGDGTITTFTGSSVTEQHSYSAGTYNITVNASDSDGGNAAPRSTTAAQQVSLRYNVSEFQDPVNRTGMTMSVFKYGSTIPLKVIITDCNNQPVNGLVPRISFTKVDPTVPAIGINEGLSTQPNDTNFLMRDAGNGQYIYNLNTKSLADGDATYKATITDSKATQTAPATYGPKVTQNFGLRSK